MLIFFVFLTALFTAMLLVALLMRWAHELRLVDIPDMRKVHARAIPRIGGVGMVLGFVASVLIWMNLNHEVRVFLGAVLVIAGFGLWDDRANLNYKLKFSGQLFAVLIAVFSGGVMIETLSFWDGETLPKLVSVPLTVFFLLGMTNAMNLSDGLDGLAAGLAMLSLVCVMALSMLAEDTHELMMLSVAIVGSTLGFLRYNTHPAQVFMGDTGSQFLGFSLGVLAIRLTQQENTALAPELPLMILGLPIIDTLIVMASRMAKKRSPFKPDRNHLHHKLLELGFDHYEAVLVIYVIQSVFVVSAYLMRYESAWLLLSSYAAASLVIVLSYPLAMAFGWRLRDSIPGQVSLISQGISKLRKNRWLEKMPYFLVSYLVFGFMVVGSVLANQFPSDVGYFALVVVPVSLLLGVFKLAIASLAQRLSIYSCAIVVIYLLETTPCLIEGACSAYIKYFFVGLAVLIALGVRYSGRGFFALTPSDFLVMFILLAVAYLPVFQELNYAKLAIESAVLLYGVEFVLRRHRSPTRIIWGGALTGLMVVGGRVLL